MTNQSQSSNAVGHLVAALVAELANELPDNVHLEGVRADLLAASRSYDQGKVQEFTLRFYLAFRSLLSEFGQAQQGVSAGAAAPVWPSQS